MKTWQLALMTFGLFLYASKAQATILDVTGDGLIISAPTSVADDSPGAEGEIQLGFDERQGVLLHDDLQIDGGTIAKGTLLDSHLIFLNTSDNGTTLVDDVVWEFSGDVLGVMSDSYGRLEAASNSILGALGTSYPGAFRARGMENSQDFYEVDGRLLEVSMYVSEPGDWIRVVTAAAAVPEPATATLLGFSLVGYGLRRKRQQDV